MRVHAETVHKIVCLGAAEAVALQHDRRSRAAETNQSRKRAEHFAVLRDTECGRHLVAVRLAQAGCR